MTDIPAYTAYSSHSYAISTLTLCINTYVNSLALNLNLDRVGIDYDYLHMFTVSHNKHQTNTNTTSKPTPKQTQKKPANCFLTGFFVIPGFLNFYC
jgi:hypothetical protein